MKACNQGYILQFFLLKLELWFRSYDNLNETRHILSKYSLAYALKTDTTVIKEKTLNLRFFWWSL